MSITVEQYRALNRQHSKHNNKIITRHGLTFLSIAQADRWDELLLCERAGLIKDLKHEVPFKFEVNGMHICTYKADATYYDNQVKIWVAEDTKGHRTRLYQIKAKLFKALYPEWWFREVEV